MFVYKIREIALQHGLLNRVNILKHENKHTPQSDVLNFQDLFFCLKNNLTFKEQRFGIQLIHPRVDGKF